MSQLATQGRSVAPPAPMLGPPSNKKMYVYDIEHNTSLARPTMEFVDIAGVLVADVNTCPVPWGAKVTGTGDVIGMDMYGQVITETLAGASLYTFVKVLSAPAGAAWVSEFSLPYRWLQAALGAPVIGTYAPPNDTNGDARGTFIPDTFDVELELYYVADRDDLFGEVRDRFSSEEFGASAIVITGTVDGTGAVAVTIPVTTPAVPVEIKLPDGQIGYFATGTTANMQISELWMQQYGRQIRDGALALSNLVTADALGNEYPPVYVQLTGTVEPTDDPDPDPVEEPLFTGPYDAEGTPYFVRTADGHIGLNQDADPDPDLFVTPQVVRDANVPDTTKQAVHDQLIALGFAGLPDWPPADDTVAGGGDDTLSGNDTGAGNADEPVAEPVSFSTHAEADTWLANSGLAEPEGWADMLVREKEEWANNPV